MSPTTSPGTSLGLLRRLALPDDPGAWEVFVVRYTPLINERCQRAGLQPADADDVRAQVFHSLVRALAEFHYDPARTFRGYLRVTVDNAIRAAWRALRTRPGWVGLGRAGESEWGDLPAPLSEMGGELDERIHGRLALLARLVERVRVEFEAGTWEAFWLTAVDGLAGEEAAARLGKSAAAVYVAKSRVLARLREVAGELTAGD